MRTLAESRYLPLNKLFVAKGCRNIQRPATAIKASSAQGRPTTQRTATAVKSISVHATILSSCICQLNQLSVAKGCRTMQRTATAVKSSSAQGLSTIQRTATSVKSISVHAKILSSCIRDICAGLGQFSCQKAQDVCHFKLVHALVELLIFSFLLLD